MRSDDDDAANRLGEDRASIGRLIDAYALLPAHAPGEKAAMRRRLVLELRVYRQVLEELVDPLLDATATGTRRSQDELAAALDHAAAIDPLSPEPGAQDEAVQRLARLWKAHAAREPQRVSSGLRHADGLAERIASRTRQLTERWGDGSPPSSPEDEDADPVGRSV